MVEIEIALPDSAGLAETFSTAEPFPHVVLDDFLDLPMIDALLAEFLTMSEMELQFSSPMEIKSSSEDPAAWGPVTRQVMSWLNGPEVLAWLQDVTGINGLIPDNSFRGGGLHRTRRGGKLGIHADFNRHRVTGNARRLNLLIYMNRDWQPEWGGELELWARDMSRCVRRVSPIAGRAVIFATDADSFHGHPDPLDCPPEVSRKSLALYYYTAPDGSPDPAKSTQFQVRPGSADQSAAPSGLLRRIQRRAVRSLAGASVGCHGREARDSVV